MAGAVDSTAISLAGLQSNTKQEIVYSAGAVDIALLACRAILINRVSSAGAVDSTAISLSGMQSNSKQEIVYSAGAVDIAPLAC